MVGPEPVIVIRQDRPNTEVRTQQRAFWLTVKMQDVGDCGAASHEAPKPCDDTELKLNFPKRHRSDTSNMFKPNAVCFKTLVLVVAAQDRHPVSTASLFDGKLTNPSLNRTTKSESHRNRRKSYMYHMQGLKPTAKEHHADDVHELTDRTQSRIRLDAGAQ